MKKNTRIHILLSIPIYSFLIRNNFLEFLLKNRFIPNTTRKSQTQPKIDLNPKYLQTDLQRKKKTAPIRPDSQSESDRIQEYSGNSIQCKTLVSLLLVQLK